jgi:tRNA(adenine34) deaminase
MKQEITELYDEFTHRGPDRRMFMSRLAELAGGTAAAATALALLRADPARAAVVAADDPRVTTESVVIASGGAELNATPAGTHERFMRLAIQQGRRNPAAPFGAVIVRVADGVVMARGVNASGENPTLHGEIAAMNNYVRRHGNAGWGRMVLYTTAEPCPMCMSALIWADIGGVVYGTSIFRLKRVGFDQIDLTAAIVAAAAPFWRGGLLGGVLAAETNRLFANRERS